MRLRTEQLEERAVGNQTETGHSIRSFDIPKLYLKSKAGPFTYLQKIQKRNSNVMLLNDFDMNNRGHLGDIESHLYY